MNGETREIRIPPAGDAFASSETSVRSAESEEFRAEWHKLVLIIAALDAVDLQKLRRTVERAETVGPILMPTEFRDGRQNLIDQRRVLDTAIALKDTSDALKKRAT